jgi:hypothetical protein
VCTARRPFRASGVNSARGRPAYSVVESLVTSFRMTLYRRRERSFGWGESTGLPSGKCVPPRHCCEPLEESSSNGQDSYRGSLWVWSRRVIKTRGGCALFGRLRSFMRGGVVAMFVTKRRRCANLVIRLRSSHRAISLPPAVVTQGDIHKHVAEGSLETDHQRFGVFTAFVAFVGREQ